MNKLFNIIVLLLVAYFEISSAERKVSRNVPVGADVKTVVNFDCPEEFGYYPHPNDCTQYYVCVFGGALLESCTGGLMYSHELQTCDWPRNVGCDGAELAAQQITPTASSSSSSSRTREEIRSRYTPPTPPPAQPAAIVTSRGQPRQLNHDQQEIIKQQRLYAEAEETLPPAEEIENDRQQRVYRGQPSTVGQVQRDRDGIKHSNTISSYNGRNEKIGVISFGTQQQPLQQQQYSELTDNYLLTNDLTEKRRRKRQTQLQQQSHHHGTEVNSWRGLPNNKRNPLTRINPAQLTLQPPPLPQNIYKSNHLNQNNFIPITNVPINDNYQTLPQLKRYPSHTIVNTKPFTQKTIQNDNYQYYSPLNIDNSKPTSIPIRLNSASTSVRFNPTSVPIKTQDNYSYTGRATTFKPIISTEEFDMIKPSADYSYNNGKIVQPDYKFKENKNNSPQPTIINNSKTTGNYNKYKPSSTHAYKNEEHADYSQNYYIDDANDDYAAEKLNDNSTDDFYKDYISNKYFTPPPSFFNTKNKYADIVNPFADPNFNFDEFIDRLRGPQEKANLQVSESLTQSQQVSSSTSTTTTTTSTTTTTTTKPPPVYRQNVKNITKNYNVTNDNNNRNKLHNHRNLYSSQIKPTINSNNNNNNNNNYNNNYNADDYYEEYDDADNPKDNLSDEDYNNSKKVAKPTKSGEIKYSAKYQESPVKIIKSSAKPFYTPQTYQTNLYPLQTHLVINKNNNNKQKYIPTTINSIITKYLTTTTQIPYYNTQQKRPKLSTTARPTPTLTNFPREHHRHRLTDKPTATRNDDDDNKRLHSNVYQRVEQNNLASPQAPISTATATARALYNSSQYNSNHYDPYYTLYEDDDVELYRDVDYAQQYNNNNNNNNNAAQQQQQQQQQPQQRPPQQIYRGTPSTPIKSTPAQEEPLKRGNSAYIPNNYNNQDIYQQSTIADYNEDNSYNAQQVDDQNNYRQLTRQPSRGDRNDLNYVEEATTKRTTTTTTRKPTTTRTVTTTTTLRTIPTKKSTVPRLPVTTNENKTQAQSVINKLLKNPGKNPTPKSITKNILENESKINKPDLNMTYKPIDTFPDSSTFRETIQPAIVNKPAPFTYPTTEKSIAFHYITKKSRSTNLVSRTVPINNDTDYSLSSSEVNRKIIIPTTYSPPKFFLKSILTKPVASSTVHSHNTNLYHYRNEDHQKNNDTNSNHRSFKTLKAVRKLINPILVNHELSATLASFVSAESIVSDNEDDIDDNLSNYDQSSEEFGVDLYNTTTTTTTTTTKPTTKSTTTTTTTTTKPITDKILENKFISSTSLVELKLKNYHIIEDDDTNNLKELSQPRNNFRTTIEIPPVQAFDEYKSKTEPDQPPDYKLKPQTKQFLNDTTIKTDVPNNIHNPVRVSRVNAAIKSLIAFGGTRRQNTKCHENLSKCNDQKQRIPARGRGTTHYTNGGSAATNNEVATVNRGTPATRSRPTLKPSTSIVSKASEFIDIYRFPPDRPEPIYPQPQPDKTAAKCRKDVCLLPDCSCGGKEIPGDLPVEQVPQIVLLTFDDSVNDLNKGLYSDLFEKGRVNPNGCPIAATFYVSHEWTDYSQVQNLYADGHELASHTVSHSFGEQFSQKKWTREVAGQREILSAYGGVRLSDIKGMRAPFLSVGGNKMFKMLYDSNFTYDSSMPIYENKPPSWPYTLDYKLFHDCMIPPCPTRSYPGVWEVPMVMWQDLNGGRCSMGDACSNPPDSEGVFKMLTKNFQRHYTTNRAPFGLFYHAAWFTQPHHKEGFINFLDSIIAMKDVWLVTNWQAIQWIRDPTPTSRLGSFQPFQCDYSDRPKRCNNPKVCNLWHKSGVRYMRTCQPCPDIYPWTGNTGIRSSRIDNDIDD